MNIFLHELRAYWKAAVIWALSLSLLGAFMLSLFPSISNNAEEMQQILAAYPEAVLKAFGVTLESFASILGYYPFIFEYVLLCGAIQAMYFGTSVIAKEVRGKTVDFLFAKPVSRQQIMTSKIMAVLASLVFTNIVYIGVSTYVATLVSEKSFPIHTFVLVSATLFFVQLIFFALGILFSAVFAKVKSMLSLTLGTVFFFFIISLLESAFGEKKFRFLIPFEYFDLHYTVQNASYETGSLILSFGIVIIAIVIGYFVYAKKDIGA